MADLTGRSIIGFQAGGGGEPSIFGINPATGESLQPGYAAVSEAELGRAAELAAEAFEIFGKSSGAARAAFLRKIADNIEATGDDLAKRVPQETGLPEGRIRMETGRTCGQLRLFASVAEEGSWVDARIDHADRERGQPRLDRQQDRTAHQQLAAEHQSGKADHNEEEGECHGASL